MSKKSQPDEIRIVLIGKTGCGKSATGNTILGREEFRKSSGFNSVTSKCTTGTRHGETDLAVVDTPGFYDSAKPDRATIDEVLKCLAMVSPGPHVFLWVINGSERFNNRDPDVLRIMEECFGNLVKSFVILVFTHADQVEGDFRQALEAAPEALNNILEAVENRWVALSNNSANPVAEADDLMDTVRTLVNRNEGPFSNKLTQDTASLVEARIVDIQSRHKIDYAKAKAQFRTDLGRNEEHELINQLYTKSGEFVGGCLGGILGGFAGAAVSPAAAIPGVGFGAAAGATAGSIVGKGCSMM